MNLRVLGKTGWEVSEVGFGTWQVGGGWGKAFDPKKADLLLHTAFDLGINFVDTADVYDGGLSEAAVGKAIKERTEKIYVATKCGRRIQPHLNEGYTTERLRRFVEDSLRNLGTDRLDMIQLHCPPSEVYLRDDIFELFENLKTEGKIDALGVSVEKIAEAEQSLKYEIVSAIQIIFNLFRQRPSADFFKSAAANGIGLIIRVPLASGLLSGKITAATNFGKDDHRHFNREGKAFDKGETFSGVPLEMAFPAIEELKESFAGNQELAIVALRWILMFGEVGTVIPGASQVEQVVSNVKSATLEPLTNFQMQEARRIYKKHIEHEVHQLW